MNEAVSFETLSRNAMQLSARMIVDASDIVFVLWPDGHIAETSLGEHTRLDIDTDNLRNRDVTEIVRAEDADRLRSMVNDARGGKRPRPIKLRHSSLIQDGTVARYSAHLAGDGKNIMLLGSALSAELSLSAQAAHAEIAHNRREDRQMNEARYRLLFESSSEGLLVVDHASGLIEQANGNAAALLGQSAESLIGTPLWSHFADDPEDTRTTDDTDVDRLETIARVQSTADLVQLSSRTVRSLLGTMLIVRLNRAVPRLAPMDLGADTNAVELLRQTSVPLLLTDHHGIVCWFNGALAALVHERQILGLPVSDVLGVSSHALEHALRQANVHGRTPTSLSALDSRLAIAEDAYLTIVAIPDGGAECYGFLIHMLGDGSPHADTIARPESSALADLVGKAPLKTLVRKSTDVIERGCIEAALRLTGNNRAAAAGVLGLSRQSLYLKMREHNLG